MRLCLTSQTGKGSARSRRPGRRPAAARGWQRRRGTPAVGRPELVLPPLQPPGVWQALRSCSACLQTPLHSTDSPSRVARDTSRSPFTAPPAWAHPALWGPLLRTARPAASHHVPSLPRLWSTKTETNKTPNLELTLMLKSPLSLQLLPNAAGRRPLLPATATLALASRCTLLTLCSALHGAP